MTSTRWTCPTCSTSLEPGTLHEVAVSRCASCGGVWFDEEGFREAKDLADENLRWLDFDLWKEHESFTVPSHGVDCPCCGKRMFTLRYADTPVEVDTCHDCRGVWLDEKEFERIVSALEDELARMPASELLAAAFHEAAEIVKGPESLLSEWKDTARVLQLLKLRILVDHPGLRRLFVEFQKGTPFN